MLQQWRTVGLRARLLVQASLALSIILVAFLAASLQALDASTREAMQERVVLARVMADHVDSQLSHAVEMLRSVLTSEDMKPDDANLEPEKALLQSLFDRSALFKRVLLLDATGTILWTIPYSKEIVGVNLAAPPINAYLGRGPEPTFSQAVGLWSQNPGIAIRIPIVDTDGAITGYISGWIEVVGPAASTLIYPYQPGSSGYTDLIDERGVVLTSTRPERIGQISNHADYFSSLIQKKQATVGNCHSCHDSLGAGREDDVLAFAPLTGIPWGVALHQPEADIMVPTRMLAYRLGALGLVVLVTFLGMVWMTTRGAVQPLQALAQACKRIASGDLSHPIPVTGVAETLALASSFEEMRRRLLDSREQAESYRQDLERRVEERTAELAKSYEELQQSRDHLLRLNRDLSALNAVAATVNRSLNLETILDSALEKALAAVPAEAGGIFLVEPQEEYPRLAVQRGLPVETLPALQRPPLWIIREGNGVAEPPAGDSWHLACREWLSARLSYGSTLCVPLETSGQVLGTLFVLSSARERFSREEEALLVSIGWQVAMAVRNVRSFQAQGELLHRVIAAQEEERRRVARELHDDTCQALTGLIVGLDTTRLALAVDPEEALGRLDAARSVATEMLEGIRRLIADLRPSLLDDLGLVPAIVWYGEKRLKPQGIVFDLEQHGMERRLPPAIETALFRIAQEGMSNVAKHSGASRVAVTVRRVDGYVSLTMEDNGRGFRRRAQGTERLDGRGLGLRGMQERATILGGTFALESAPGRGTRLSVRIPLTGEEDHG